MSRFLVSRAHINAIVGLALYGPHVPRTEPRPLHRWNNPLERIDFSDIDSPNYEQGKFDPDLFGRALAYANSKSADFPDGNSGYAFVGSPYSGYKLLTAVEAIVAIDGLMNQISTGFPKVLQALERLKYATVTRLPGYNDAFANCYSIFGDADGGK